MPIDYKKLIPHNLRETRWGEFIEAVQSVLTTIKTNKIDIIENQFNIDEMTLAQINNMRDFLGYQFLNFGTGYTSSSRYLERQLLTIANRVIKRTTHDAFRYNFYIYDLIAEVYPMTYESSTETFSLITDWWTWDESIYNIVDRLDLGDTTRTLFTDSFGNPVYADPQDLGMGAQTLDSSSFPNLDMKTIHDRLSRHIIVPYSFNFVEDNDYFLTEETTTAFYTDLNYAKRATELLYMEPICTINCSGVPGSSSGVTTSEQYFSYDNSSSGIVESIYFGSSVSGVTGISGIAEIQFGTGGYTPITLSQSSGVETPITLSGVTNGTIAIGSFEHVTANSSINFNVRKSVTQKYKFTNYSEIALLDSNSGVVLYAKFPDIVYLTDVTKCYHGVQLDINLV